MSVKAESIHQKLLKFGNCKQMKLIFSEHKNLVLKSPIEIVEYFYTEYIA